MIDLGTFIYGCLRSAGDPDGRMLNLDYVMAHIRTALAYALNKFPVPVVHEYTIVTAGESLSIPHIHPAIIRVNDRPCDPIARGSGRYGWSEEQGEILFWPALSVGDEVAVYGRLRHISLTIQDRAKSLVLHVSDPLTELQWVPPGVDDLVRYRVLQRLSEDLGQVEKASYWNRMAHETELTSLAQIQVPTGPSIMMASDGFDE